MDCALFNLLKHSEKLWWEKNEYREWKTTKLYYSLIHEYSDHHSILIKYAIRGVIITDIMEQMR